MYLDSSVSLWAGIQSTGDLVSETSQVRILLSAEVDNLSPFDSNIACLCQSIEINNKKHVCMYVCMYVYMYVYVYIYYIIYNTLRWQWHIRYMYIVYVT